MSALKKKKALWFWLTAVLLVAVIVAVFGKTAYDYLHRQYLLNEYPLRYVDAVEAYAEENGVDKYLVFAIIKTESGYNKDAVSSVGARGLMQFTEETFDWVKYRLGDETSVYDDMFDPQTNIRYGAYLIGFLTRYFESRELAVCAYHAGIGSVESWLANPEYSADGVTLSEVPTRDTEYYLYKINKAVEIYSDLYKEE